MISARTRARVLTGFLLALGLPMFARGCARVIRHLPGGHHTVSAKAIPLDERAEDAPKPKQPATK
jgi:hypothetical protein